MHMVVAIGIALALGACTSTSSSGSGQTTTGMGFTAAQLCGLVTTAEMSAALGTTVGDGVGSGVNAPACVWQSQTATEAGATIAADDPTTVGQIPFGLQNLTDPHVTAVSGLGDAAFFAAANIGLDAELDIKKGGRAITITVGFSASSTQAAQEAAEMAIGVAAAKRL
jgi:hypothetical protein